MDSREPKKKKSRAWKVVSETIGPFLWRIAVVPITALYGLVVAIRNALYNSRLFPVFRVPVKVISVGNLSVGGTGKTPFAEFLLDYYTAKGLSVGYLSRGYRRKTDGFRVVNPDRDTHEDVGDEPLMVAGRHVKALIAVCEDRVEGAREMLKQRPLDCIVLDDAFQHRKIARDLDIVMIDGQTPPWKDALLPSGRLREPLSSLERADVVVVTRIYGEKELKNFQREAQKVTGREFVYIGYKIRYARPFSPDYPDIPAEKLHRRSCIAFCGIGNNLQFEEFLRLSSIQVLRFYTFSDHHAYKPRDLKRITRKYRRLSRQDIYLEPPIIITTEKDFARIKHCDWFWEELSGYPFYYVSIQVEILKGGSLLERKLNGLFDRLKNEKITDERAAEAEARRAKRKAEEARFMERLKAEQQAANLKSDEELFKDKLESAPDPFDPKPFGKTLN
ncbi:MAG: tetraacyldisaccharide 4'-kinase [Bacteroidia bacterium]|nr:tetraacyldisaccharide 4'-kinase [Bacteroidia bacterium]